MSKWLLILKCIECGAAYSAQDSLPTDKDGVETCFCGGRLDIADVVDDEEN